MHDVKDHSEPVPTDTLSQLKILRHYSHPLCMNSAQISILKQRHQVCLRCLLQRQNCLTLETHLLLELSSNFPHQTLEWQLADQQICLNLIIITLFWNLRISLKATVPGLNLWGFFKPEEIGADFLATFWATNCFRGTF